MNPSIEVMESRTVSFRSRWREDRTTTVVERDMAAIFGQDPLPLPQVKEVPVESFSSREVTGVVGSVPRRRGFIISLVLAAVLGSGGLVVAAGYFRSDDGSLHRPTQTVANHTEEGVHTRDPAGPVGPREHVDASTHTDASTDEAVASSASPVAKAPVAKVMVAVAPTRTVKPVRKPSCRGSSYERMPSCPSGTVVAADRQLGAAYATAIHAGVDGALLAHYSQLWSQLRHNGEAAPAETVTAYRVMARELNALTSSR